MVARPHSLGCTGYWSDGWNTLDGVIVSLSIAEMVLTQLLAADAVKLSFLRVLRMLRLLRVLRLMRAWKGLYTVISTMLKAMPQLSNIFLLLFTISMIFSILGMQVRASARRQPCLCAQQRFSSSCARARVAHSSSAAATTRSPDTGHHHSRRCQDITSITLYRRCSHAFASHAVVGTCPCLMPSTRRDRRHLCTSPV